MIGQFEIHGGVKKELQTYLDGKGLTLRQAMDEQESNKEVAAIIHAGLPGMVRKIYALPKMETFFWEKKELMVEFVAQRLAAADKKPKKK